MEGCIHLCLQNTGASFLVSATFQSVVSFVFLEVLGWIFLDDGMILLQDDNRLLISMLVASLLVLSCLS